MIWLILAIVVLSLLSVIAFTRIQLTVDSVQHMARLSWGRVVAAELTEVESLPVFRLRIFGWTRQRDVLRMLCQPGAKKKDKHEAGSKRHGKNRISMRRIVKLIRSFRVKRFRLVVDTDDYILNAWLWPVIEFLRSQGMDITVNFNGVNEMQLEVYNRPVRMLIAWFK